MEKAVLRFNSGLYYCLDVFEPTKYDHIRHILQEIVANNAFEVLQHPDDYGFEHHPLWLPTFDHHIQSDILGFVNSTIVPNLFRFAGQISEDDVSASFVMFYSPTTTSMEEALSTHKDQPMIPGRHVLSVIYTIKENCKGGALAYSNKWNGEQNHSRDLTNFTPPTNSIYCFNGDYVSHKVFGIDSGVRFAVVLFINTPQTDLDVAMLWQSDKAMFCPRCFKGFTTEKGKATHSTKCNV